MTNTTITEARQKINGKKSKGGVLSGDAQRRAYLPMLLPALLVLIAIVAFPTVYLLYVSLHQWLVYTRGMIFVGLGNFIGLFRAAEFWDSIGVTIIYVGLSTLLTTTVGFSLALLMSNALRGQGLVRTIIVLPLIVPPVVAGFAWKFLLSREVGLIGGWILPMLGLQTSMLADPNLAMVSVLIADLWSKTPLMFLIFLAGLQAIPTELYEMAAVEGARTLQMIRNITLPLLQPTIILAVVLRFIDAMNVFDVIFVMTSGGPGTATLTLPLLGWKIGFYHLDLGVASALAVIMIILMAVPSNLLIRRMFRFSK
jgi:multiple sugar transport system permease protein